MFVRIFVLLFVVSWTTLAPAAMANGHSSRVELIVLEDQGKLTGVLFGAGSGANVDITSSIDHYEIDWTRSDDGIWRGSLPDDARHFITVCVATECIEDR